MLLKVSLPRPRQIVHSFLLGAFVCSLCLSPALHAQTQQLPYMNAGPNSVFAQIDFAKMISDEQTWDQTSKNLQNTLTDSGVVSLLDLQAPDSAVKQYKQGTSALKSQDTKEAIRCFQKAVKLYPDFVSAHNALGVAYMDQQDPRARAEFETAVKLDDKFAGPLLNLGLLALAANDFAMADSNLEKAAALEPDDPRVLGVLAFAQNGNHRYAESMQTVRRVHALGHRGFANIHYIGAAAAMALHDVTGAESQLKTFVTEDPTNPLSPIARQRLEALASGNLPAEQAGSSLGIEEIPGTYTVKRVTFPNSQYLQAQLRSVANDPDTDECDSCDAAPDPAPTAPHPDLAGMAIPNTQSTSWRQLFTIHQVVDETALFFSVSHHGRSVNDLSISDIKVQDGNKAPDKILQFIPQSKLPLRLGLLIDASDSVRDRVVFEKRAAEKFIDKVLTSDSDLAFVGGFQSEVSVSQDFTRDSAKLVQGVENLTSGGDGTAIFDAVFFACWKLSAYPDQGRTAKVLVVLTDGQDNSSHRSLKQAIAEAEAAGVTVYTLSTAEKLDDESDANQILKTLAERTGGEAIFPGSLSALDYNLNRLPQAIRSRYLVAYRPADFKPDGKFRRIRVTADKGGEHLRVQVRKGYYARLALSPN
jgi:Ca-activated chloride channel family protein